MAFTSGAVWDVQTGGDDTNNGGGFDTGVAGFPTDGAATVANTASPVFTSASYTFVSPGDVNAWLYIKSGTNWTPGFYQIVSVSGGAATLSAAIGTPYTGADVYTQVPSTVVGCATVASPTGATWGIDYSQSTSARFTSATFAIDATTNTKLTDGTNTIGKNWVGNVISITAGTGFTVQRVAVVSTTGTAATVDKSLGTLSSTSGAGKLGGSFASPGLASAVMVGRNICYVKSGTLYSITSATANISGGCIICTQASSVMQGWTTGRYLGSTDTTSATIQLNVSTATMFGTSNGITALNFILDGNSQTASKLSSGGRYIRCTIQNFNTVSTNTGSVFIACLATGNSAGVILGNAVGCEAYGNTATPIIATVIVETISYDNTGASTDGASAAVTFVKHFTSVGNGRRGLDIGNGGSTSFVMDSIFQNNTGAGVTAGQGTVLMNVATYNNTGGRSSGGNVNADINPITNSADSFTSTAGHDYSLNNLAGAGAALRAAAFGRLFPRGTTSTYWDIGAVQHADPASGGSAVAIFSD